MTCSLPAPKWINVAHAGLQSSNENNALSSYDLSWGTAESGVAGAPVFYNIYWGSDIFSLFDTPKAFSEFITASIPKAFIGDGYYFGVRASELGTTLDFDSQNLSGLLNGLQDDNVSAARRNFLNERWVPLNATLESEAEVSPSGFSDAFAIIPSTATAEHAAQNGIVITNTEVRSFSVFAKKGNQDWIFLHNTQKNNYRAWYDLANGLVGTKEANVIDATIEDVGDGWFRCAIISADTIASHTAGIHSAAADNTTIFAGDGYTPSTYLFGAIIEDGYVPSSYSLDVAGESRAFLYPSTVSTLEFYDTSTILHVNSVAGFPEVDGYVKIGAEILFYSSAFDGYDGYGGNTNGAFRIANRDPFGCNDGYFYPIGTSVELFRGFEDNNGVSFIPGEVCVPEEAVWAEESRPGLMSAGDLGIGQVVELHWGVATAPTGMSLLFNVYWDTSLETLWDQPRGITAEQSVLVPDLSPGDGYYFAVRATYFTEDLELSDFEQLSGQLYAYPSRTYLTADYADTGTDDALVNSTDGFPSFGFIVIGSEILQYSAKTATSFTISRRDVFDFGQENAHSSGDDIRFWYGIEDGNLQYYHNVATWDKGELAPLMPIPAGGPAYMQDSDGYRAQPIDNLTEDHSNFEDTNQNFNPYPFCGYRVTDFTKLYTRQICNTYFGGRQDGFGGVDINTVNLQRQELLLGITGEPFTLLRRKWTGRQCPKYSLRHEHPHARCGMCYGTTFDGGYDRFVNPRNLRPSIDNPNGLIMARVAPYKNDLERSPERGLTQVDQVPAWTLPVPELRDSDILIRYIFDPITLEIIREDFRYSVLDVTRNRIIVGDDGQQAFNLRKLDKSDIIYTYDVPII